MKIKVDRERGWNELSRSIQIKETSKRLIMLMIALAVVAYTAFAWFTFNKLNTVKPIEVGAVDGSEISIKLFHYLPSKGEYEEIPQLICSNYLPGQTEKYYIEISSRANKAYRVSLDYMNFKGEKTADKTPEENFTLCNVLTLQGLSADPVLGAGEQMVEENTLQQLIAAYSPADPLNTSFRFAQITMEPQTVRKLYFDLYMPGDIAGNLFQELAVSLEKISITISEKIS